MDKRLITEPFETKGVWWLPENSGKRVYGNLKFDPFKGASLDLYGSLHDKGLSIRTEIILGELPGGKPISLLFCHGAKFRSVYALTRSEGFTESKISAQYVFEGQHFLTPADIKFDNLSFGFSHLRNWAKFPNAENLHDNEKVTITQPLLSNIDVLIPNLGKLSIYYGFTLSSSNKNSILEKHVSITIAAEQSYAFEHWWRIRYLLQVFLSFAARHAVHSLSLSETKPIELEFPNGEVVDHLLRTDISFKLPQIPDDSSTEDSYGMLFNLDDISDQIELCFQNWFQKAEKLEPVYELYFGTLHNPKMYPIHRYLSLAQALESYHRGTSDRSAFPKAEFKSRMEEILDSVPDQYMSWVQEKLNFCNEPSLMQRLEDIMQIYTDIFEPLTNQTEFIKKVRDTRNYLTHYDIKSKKRAAHGEELYLLSESLKILIEMCLLKELGIDNAKIRKIILRGNDRHWFTHPVAGE